MRRMSFCFILLFIFLLSCSTTSIFSSSSPTHTPGGEILPTGSRDTLEESESLSPIATETMIPWALNSTASALFAGTPTQKTTIDLPITQQFGELSYYLKDVDFMSESTGWAVGEPHWDQALRKYVGTIIKTTDGGATWTPQDAGPVGTLHIVDFVDENTGWAVGAGGVILHTSDGGVHWALQPIDSQDEFRGVAFVSPTEGWVSGSHGTKFEDYLNAYVNWKGSIWHTTDGGASWKQQQVPESASLLTRMKFINAQEGWVVGTKDTGRTLGSDPIHAGEVYHTRDGGATWEEFYSPGEDISLTSIEWIGQNDGWVAGFPTMSSMPTDGYVFHTADGGKTWKKQSPGSFGDNLWDIQFVDANRGYVIGTYYSSSKSFMVSRTVDGGQTWAEVKTGDTENEGGYALSIVGDKVVLVGDNDIIARSDNAWDTPDCGDFTCLFTQSYLNPHYLFHDVFFTDETNGWAVGSKNFSPEMWGQVIMHTANGGKTWSEQYENAPQPNLFSYHRLEGVDFVDNQNGWAVGTSDGKHNAIIHTADGGQTWSEQGQELYDLWDLEFSSVQFFNLQDGWALATIHFSSENSSENMFLARTNDGGQHWAWVDTGLEGHLQIGFGNVQSMLSFPDAQHGWAAGGRYELIATSDGGATWSRQKLTCKRSELCVPRIYAVSFLDDQNGWVVGENLFHTVNGGQTWTPFDLFPEGSTNQEAEAYGEVQDLHFFNPQTGIVATDTGLVLYSSDGGARWMLAGKTTYYPLRGLHCPSAHKCWIVGEGGTILSVELPS